MTGPELQIAIGRIVAKATGHDLEIRLLTAPELHAILDDTWAVLTAEMRVAPCDHHLTSARDDKKYCQFCGREVQ
jgi:hypothetical protein